MDYQPLWLSLKLALLTTIGLCIVGVPLAALLFYSKSKLKPIAEAIISLPLVLPPSVLGFYLLLAFSPTHWLGSHLLSWFHVQLVFTFAGLVLGSMLYSLPFMVQPIQAGLETLPVNLQHAAYMLGKSRFETLTRVLLPNIKSSILSGIVLTFAHTLGEFGVVLMIGGNIPGVSRVASIAIYDEAEALNFHNAHVYSAILLAISFSILVIVYTTNKKLFKNRLAA